MALPARNTKHVLRNFIEAACFGDVAVEAERNSAFHSSVVLLFEKLNVFVECMLSISRSVPPCVLHPSHFRHKRHSEMQFMLSAGSVKEIAKSFFDLGVEVVVHASSGCHWKPNVI